MAVAGIQNAISQPAQALSNLALVTPILTPSYGPIGSSESNFGTSLGPALQFDIEGENKVTLKSDIPDEYLEDNTSESDNIALKPAMVTVHGFKGELANTFPSFLPPASQVQAILGAVGAFSPSFSVSAQNTINGAAQTYQAVQAAVNGAVTAWNSITGGQNQTVISSGGILAVGATQNKQQMIFAQFFGYWFNKTLFAVQTPWATIIPMAIEEITFTQDEKTNTITDVFITFKQIRYVSTFNTSSIVPTGRAANQSAPLTLNGSASLTPTADITTFYSAQNTNGLSF